MSLQKGVNKTPDVAPESSELAPTESRGSIPLSNNITRRTGADNSAVGGLESPIIETSRTVDNATVYDASGLIAVVFAVATSITAKDANGVEEIRHYNVS